jgi:hypothetical protein
MDQLVELLTSYENPRAFNQYRDVDEEFDLPDGAAIRCRNLRSYVGAFAAARFVLVGEAAGYAGCRFSGIPFTCEDQLVGAEPLAWTRGLNLASSSTAESLWVERSARIVWEALAGHTDCVLWNAFPWHPFQEGNPLSNRHPRRDLEDGLDVLRHFLALFPTARPYAVGRVAERALSSIGFEATYIRHPSHGGKAKFLAGVAAMRAGG